MDPPLHRAVRQGVESEIRSLLSKATSEQRSQLLATRDNKGYTPFERALQLYGRKLPVARVLLALSCTEERDTALFTMGPNGRALLHYAAESGDEVVVQEILALASSPEVRSRLLVATTESGGWTALHLAAHKGSASVVRTLLDHATAQERRSMLHAKDHQGCTPLHVTIPWIAGDDECRAAMALIEYSLPEDCVPMLQSVDRKGKTLLHHMAEKGLGHEIEALLALVKSPTDRGGVLTAECVDGCTALHLAAHYGRGVAARVLLKCGSPEERRQLLQARDLKGRTAFQHCLRFTADSSDETRRCMDVAMVLLQHGTVEEMTAMLHMRGVGGSTLLHHLAMTGDEEKARAIFATSDDPEERARLASATAVKGWTPLHTAARWGRAGMVPILLEHAGMQERARMMAPEAGEGRTPLHLAVGQDAKDEGAALSALLTACTDHETHKLLVARSDSGDTALQCIKKREILPTDAALIQNILAWSDHRGKTLLHYVVESGDMANTRILLVLASHPRERCRMIRVADMNGWTPLHRAAYFGNESACKALLACARTGEERSRMLAAEAAPGAGRTVWAFAKAGNVDLSPRPR